MADITSSVAQKEVGKGLEGLGYWVTKKITPVADGVSATGTHEIITLPAKSFVAGAKLVYTTSMASTSNNGTMQFKVGSATIGSAVTMDGTEAVAGDVFELSPNDTEDSVGQALYVTSADTVDLVIATNAITAGVFYIMVNIVELIGE